MILFPLKKEMQGISVPLRSTHVPSGAPLCFLSFFAITWWSQSIRNMSNKFHSVSIEILQLWNTYSYNNDEFNPRFNFCISETNDLCFVTQKDILISDFQITVRYLSTSQKSLQVSQSLKFSQNHMRARWMLLLNSRKLINVNKIFSSHLRK